MKLTRMDIGFVPLIDAAPLIIAREMGFASEEGLTLNLHREASWATIRDRLVWGQYQAAHMLAPMAIALSAGLGGQKTKVDTMSVLSVNGSMIGVQPGFAARMGLHSSSFLDARAVRKSLRDNMTKKLRVGVPYPFSMHALLFHYLTGDTGKHGRTGLEVITIPPPYMADAMAAGDIDAFCVGEPWGSVSVERGAADLILPTAAIWNFAPEKVLAARRDWLETNPATASALLRAVWRAARWISDPANSGVAAEILSAPHYVDVPAEVAERPLSRQMVINAGGTVIRVPRCIEFFKGAATFPWKSQALWIAEALARQTGADRIDLRQAAESSFRSDLYRTALAGIGADLPGASAKLEGALFHPTEVGSTKGAMILGPDFFFDNQVFEPELGSQTPTKPKN